MQRSCNWFRVTVLINGEDGNQVQIFHVHYTSGPQPFWHQGPVSWKKIFPWTGGWGDGFRMIEVHYIYCTLYFYYYYIVTYNEIIIQLTIMQNQWDLWACFHLPLTDSVLIWVCKQLIYYGLCASQTSLLMIICICSHSPALALPPQLYLKSSGIRFA